MRVGERLQQLREARGWSKAELARRLKASEVTVGRYEAGARQIDADALPEIAQVLDVHPSAFYLAPDETVPFEPRSPGTERMLREVLALQQYSEQEIDELLLWLDFQRWRRAQLARRGA